MDKKTASPAKPGTPQTAEAVWGSPGLEKNQIGKTQAQCKKQAQSGENKAEKERPNDYTANL
jgi:hypothetical protein